VEQLGVERSRQAAQRSQLALLVLDTSRPLDDEDAEAMAVAESVPQTVLILNKTDLPCAVEEDALCKRFPHVVKVCAKNGEGLPELTALIESLYPMGDIPRGELLTNARQAEAVGRALSAVAAAREALDFGMTPDAVLTDAEHALEALGELTGKSIREDLVATIFSRFCVGK
jgi:tRNA modification GTPase